VFCSKCEQVVVAEGWRLDAADSGPDGLATVRSLLCERCGRVLSQVRSDEYLLRRLTQMARFGIGAGSGPILSGHQR
jgi:hypothetical protein